MRQVTDEERWSWLKDNGYLPYDLYTWLVDKALGDRHCPAYWREAVGLEISANMPPRGNGMVFVKPGDRERIDQIISERHARHQSEVPNTVNLFQENQELISKR